MKTLADLYIEGANKYSDKPAFQYKVRKGKERVFEPVSYKKLLEYGENLGLSLLNLGLEQKEHIGIIADNRIEWIIADVAVQLNGAVNVPRGSDSTAEEIEYILAHADCKICFAENEKQLEKIQSIQKNTNIEKIIVLDKEFKKDDGETIFSLWKLLEEGKSLRKEKLKTLKKRWSSIKEDDLFTIIYTSGTTGAPKGVMLTHRNIMWQVVEVPKIAGLGIGERFLSILPIWHILERVVEYGSLFSGGCTYYSSIRDLKGDFSTVQPTFMVSAPRLWEKIYQGIQDKISGSSKVKKNLFNLAYKINKRYSEAKKYLEDKTLIQYPEDSKTKLVRSLGSFALVLGLNVPAHLLDEVVLKKIRDNFGGTLKGTISGGGALPLHVDEFYSAVGLMVLEGYGMTETAPIIACRTPDKTVIGSVGAVLKGCEVEIRSENGQPVAQGERGVIWIKGPQVMKGYYKNPDKTTEVLVDGWLNTGDIGFISAVGTLSITGRAKDTIVLLGGENVEPVPIENKILESDYINQVIVVGQDKKTLSALVYPNFEKLGISEDEASGLDTSSPHYQTILEEIKNKVNAENGFKSFERVTDFRFLPKAMEVGDELTNLFKMKRNVITEKYRDLIDEMG